MPLEGYPMSKPTRWALVYLVFAIACGSVIAACASGGARGDDMEEPIDAAVTVKMDGNTSVLIDAPKVKLDGGVAMADAFTPPPDAPPNSIFCSSNAMCTVSGECCVTLGGTMGFCAPGTVVLGQCFPQ
jgi:hypothetical protein